MNTRPTRASADGPGDATGPVVGPIGREVAAGPPGEVDGLLSVIFENSPDCLYLAEVEPGERYRFLSVNQTFLRVSGYSRSEVIGRPMEEVVPAANHQLVRAKYREAIESRLPVVYFETAALPAGLRHAEITLTPIFSRDGRAEYILSTIKDVTAQKQAEEAIKGSETWLRRAQKAGGIGTYNFEVADGSSTGSEVFLSLFEVPPGLAAFTSDLWKRVVHPDDRERVVAEIARCVASKDATACEGEYRIVRSDGSVRWVEYAGQIVRDENGAATRIVGTVCDITERKRAGEAEREGAERLRLALDAGRTGVWDWDIATGKITWSDRVAEFYGMAPGEFDGTLDMFARHLHPEDADRAKEAIRASVDDDAPYLIEYRIVQKGGDVRWLYTAGTVIRDPAGRPVRMIGATTDATDRKSAEADIARDALLLANVRDSVVVTDLSGVVTYWNEGATRLFGWTAAEMLGEPYVKRFADPEVRALVGSRIRSIETGDEWLMEFEDYRKDGSRIWIDARVNRVEDSTGRPVGILGLAHDITDRKRAERDLKEADRQKDEFLALLAHELRNPLAPLRNGLQVIRLAEGDGESVAQARDMMERQLGHMVRLIDDLLDVSRIGRNKMQLRRSRVPLAEVIGNAVETARPAIEAAGHRLDVALPAEAFILDGDLTRLAQVVSNLLVNSAKYTEPGGQIRLDVETHAAEVVLSVRDTGIGIPAEALPHIFDMFSQVDRSIERSTGGLGIGLALVKGLVEMHGGSVTARSDGQGLGSTFTVRLPLPDTADEPAPTARSGAPLPSDRSKRRILVVDDNRDSALSMAKLLKLLGNEVRLAHDGVDAIEAAEAFRPEVILMDVGMPRLNGYEATRRIREQPWGRPIRIIALTGWGQSDDRVKSSEAGCDAHLVKPVDFSDLEKALSSPD